MPARSSSMDWVQALLAVLFYGSLFHRTIRQNRKNRPVVLGVLTIVMVLGLGVAASLGNQLLQRVVGTASVLLALAILFSVFQDVVRWFRSKSPFHSSRNSQRRKPADSI
jgi:predicted MFS family arabinose efflux permease